MVIWIYTPKLKEINKTTRNVFTIPIYNIVWNQQLFIHLLIIIYCVRTFNWSKKLYLNYAILKIKLRCHSNCSVLRLSESIYILHDLSIHLRHIFSTSCTTKNNDWPMTISKHSLHYQHSLCHVTWIFFVSSLRALITINHLFLYFLPLFAVNP